MTICSRSQTPFGNAIACETLFRFSKLNAPQMNEPRNDERNRTFLDEMAEARAVQAEGNIGRARTCARRAVGMALREKLGLGPSRGDYASTFINGLYRLAGDENFPIEIREAAARLVDRSKEDRTSAAVNPVQDAEIILKHFRM